MLDADVLEIAPPAVFSPSMRALKRKKSNQAKGKQIIIISEDDHEEDHCDLMIIEEKDFPNKHVKDVANEHPVLKKLEAFKRFDVIVDHSDHYYTSQTDCLKLPSKAWAKKIQEEWRILEKDLPESIYVRAYETRLDLLRAVILGADGTPYHDGAFFFDVFFPSDYPNSPPRVYYHSGGLRLNPNLYNNGYVCLSLLNTWQGDPSQRWRPGYSTMLQVLVSIQGLILNSKPYYNEPGFEHRMGTTSGEKSSYMYTENTFLLSMKTMLYTIRRPPKNFEDLVVGHFFKHAHDIMAACKAYAGGALVGTLAKHGVENIKGVEKNSASFTKQLPGHIDPLVQEFVKIGMSGCENYSCLEKDEGDGEKGSGSKSAKGKRKRKS